MSSQVQYDDDYEPRGKSFFARMKSILIGDDEFGDEPETSGPTASEAHATQQKRSPGFKVHNIHVGTVSVRRNVMDYEDAKAASEGLIRGEQQIVNLERTTPEKTQRIVDFLNGACYALGGNVERVGKSVVLYTPANIKVINDDTPAAPTPTKTQSDSRSMWDN